MKAEFREVVKPPGLVLEAQPFMGWKQAILEPDAASHRRGSVIFGVHLGGGSPEELFGLLFGDF